MGLNKQYLKVGQSAKNRLFGIPARVPLPPGHRNSDDRTPLQMLVSQQGSISHCRLAVIVLGLFALAIGIILSSIPWLDYLVLKNLRLWNDTLSFHYWQKPGVLRLTKVFLFNVTNPEGFLNGGEKPRLEEIGPFVYREDMQKINVRFYENGTVTYQHKKILVFVPELSVPKDLPITVPNIPLLTLTSATKHFSNFMKYGMSIFLGGFVKMKPFKTVTMEEMVFGYDDTLTKLANKYYPRGKRPPEKMGLLLGRNGTLDEVHTMYTGHAGMENFGLLNRLNGLDHLPYWNEEPCNSIKASEGSLFPPRDLTHEDVVNVYDKDLCRIWPLRYRYDIEKEGIKAGYYSPDDSIFENGEKNSDNKCYCPGRGECPPKGLQNISPCQYDAPVYLSFPHFYQADKELLESVEGLSPDKEKHETYFKIQPKLGVTIEAKVRVQLNLKVDHSDLHIVRNFRSMVFPVMWLEEGVGELTPAIHRWVYLSTTVADIAAPVVTYGLITTGIIILVSVFVQAYKNIVFTRENIERGKQKFRRGSSLIVNGQHRLMIVRDSYTLLNNTTTETAIDSEL